eukprot:TRINITY_DN11137_c0_g1_i2.p1 TRINITY_DN11137_c0_g1~~TRINITY_DN11137_c0_g1_i2.p1  ORF type:complete len:872 (+),score=228.98 TRINITY_DN11137_c0_g1_i2:65-2680(+)
MNRTELGTRSHKKLLNRGRELLANFQSTSRVSPTKRNKFEFICQSAEKNPSSFSPFVRKRLQDFKTVSHRFSKRTPIPTPIPLRLNDQKPINDNNDEILMFSISKPEMESKNEHDGSVSDDDLIDIGNSGSSPSSNIEDANNNTRSHEKETFETNSSESTLNDASNVPIDGDGFCEIIQEEHQVILKTGKEQNQENSSQLSSLDVLQKQVKIDIEVFDVAIQVETLNSNESNRVEVPPISSKWDTAGKLLDQNDGLLRTCRAQLDGLMKVAESVCETDVLALLKPKRAKLEEILQTKQSLEEEVRNSFRHLGNPVKLEDISVEVMEENKNPLPICCCGTVGWVSTNILESFKSQEKAKFETQTNDLESQNGKLEGKLSMLGDRINVLQKKVKDKEAQLELFAEKNGKLEEELEGLKKLLLKEKNNENQDFPLTSNDMSFKASPSFLSTIPGISTKELRQEIRQLKNRQEEQNILIEKLRTALEGKTHNDGALSREVHELKNLKTELMNALMAKTKQISDLSNELSAASATINELRNFSSKPIYENKSSVAQQAHRISSISHSPSSRRTPILTPNPKRQTIPSSTSTEVPKIASTIDSNGSQQHRHHQLLPPQVSNQQPELQNQDQYHEPNSNGAVSLRESSELSSLSSSTSSKEINLNSQVNTNATETSPIPIDEYSVATSPVTPQVSNQQPELQNQDQYHEPNSNGAVSLRESSELSSLSSSTSSKEINLNSQVNTNATETSPIPIDEYSVATSPVTPQTVSTSDITAGSNISIPFFDKSLDSVVLPNTERRYSIDKHNSSSKMQSLSLSRDGYATTPTYVSSQIQINENNPLVGNHQTPFIEDNQTELETRSNEESSSGLWGKVTSWFW